MLMVVTLRSAAAGVWPFGASQSRPARLPAPDVVTTSQTRPQSAQERTRPAISAILGGPPPSTNAVRAPVSLRWALSWLFAARFALYRVRGEETTCSGAVAEVAFFLAMEILLAGLVVRSINSNAGRLKAFRAPPLLVPACAMPLRTIS